MTEYLDRYPTMHEYAEGKRINPKLTDYIKRADAIAYIDRVINSGLGRNKSLDYIHKYISALPSTDAVPTVIRAKTFMRKEDFDKWAEDIKKQNKSIVCIPCDAEVVSADAVQGEWQIIGYDKDYIPIQYTCSVCGSKFLDEYNFCPDCGARMTPYKGGDGE